MHLRSAEAMALGRLRTALHYIGRRLREQPVGSITDRDLLVRFVRGHDQEAFAGLVERHGAMVLGVCRRVLSHDQDAEDAFQAVFPVAAGKAASLRWQDTIGPWLYQVAYRVALKARASAARRHGRERELIDMPHEVASNLDIQSAELRLILDEELNRLPAKYRAPLVLCYLQGKTNVEAASELGWTKGTVSGRLARGRDLLRRRLTRRGVSLPAGALVGLLTPEMLATPPSPPLAGAALRLAADPTGPAVRTCPAGVLAESVARDLSRRKALVAAVSLFVGLLGSGLGLWAASPADKPAPVRKTDGSGPPPKPPDPRPRQQTWKERAVLAVGPRGIGAYSGDFSPDGKTVALALVNGHVLLYDVANRKTQATWKAHNAQAVCVAFSPDGKSI